MADYFVAATGSNTAPYETWAKAATSLATALAAASTDGDRVILQHDGVPSADAELAADTTYTFAANVSLICSTNSGTSTITPTAQGTATWVGNSTTNRSVTLAGAFSVFIYGLTIRLSGSTNDNLIINNTAGGYCVMKSCYLWLGITTGSSFITSGGPGASTESQTILIDTTLRFGESTQGIKAHGALRIEGGSCSSAGTAPTVLFVSGPSKDGSVILDGVDLSHITGSLVGNQSGGYHRFWFSQCKFGSGVTVMDAQTTTPNPSGCGVFVADCASGDEHYHFQYHNALGSLTTDTSIYANDGASYNAANAKHSWKIVTTANASPNSWFISPWISVHHEGTSAITPNLECVRSGSATAYQNDEIWAEFMVKATSGVPLGTIDRSDRMALAGTPADQTTGSLGAGDWTGENATSWFGKLSPTATITPAELGDLCARVCVAEPSITVYVDPQIRGRS